MSDPLISVRTSEYVASDDRTIVLQTTSLGSCVAIALYDTEARVGGLCHCLLDRVARFAPGEAAGRCADTAIPALVEAMVAMGASQERLTACIAGGGNMFATVDPIYDVGEWNVSAARDTLILLAIPLRGEDVGGGNSRRLRIDIASGKVTVLTSQGRSEVL